MHIIADIPQKHDKIGRSALEMRHSLVHVIHYIIGRCSVQVGKGPYIDFLLTVIACKSARLGARISVIYAVRSAGRNRNGGNAVFPRGIQMLHRHGYGMYIIVGAHDASFLIIHPVILAVICIIDVSCTVHIGGPNDIVYIPAQKYGGLNLDGNTARGKRNTAKKGNTHYKNR